jgi:hypothetical protein
MAFSGSRNRDQASYIPVSHKDIQELASGRQGETESVFYVATPFVFRIIPFLFDEAEERNPV